MYAEVRDVELILVKNIKSSSSSTLAFSTSRTLHLIMGSLVKGAYRADFEEGAVSSFECQKQHLKEEPYKVPQLLMSWKLEDMMELEEDLPFQIASSSKT